MKCDKRREWERGRVRVVGVRYSTYPRDGIQSYPLSVHPLTHRQSWEVCGGRRRARDEKPSLLLSRHSSTLPKLPSLETVWDPESQLV